MSVAQRVGAPQVARAVAEGLAGAGTEIVFGLPGGGNNLEVAGAAEAAGMRFILSHGETAAAIMAGVYAELTGHPGCCVVTRGPGAASAVNGLAQCDLDRQPMLLVTDTVSAPDRRRVPHQQLDQRTMLAPAAKWGAVLGGEHAADTVQTAITVALQARPGAVHLEFDPHETVAAPAPPPRPAPRGDAEQARRLVADARRPVVIAGVGVRHCMDELRACVEGTGVPVLTTYKARGAVPDAWPNAAGLFTGATVEGSLLRQADRIVAIGVDAVELIPNPWPYSAPVVSLAAWPEEHPYFEPVCDVVGDLDTLLRALAGAFNSDWPPATGLRTRLDIATRLCASGEGDGGLAPHDVVLGAHMAAPPGTRITVDAGAHMLVAMPLWEVSAVGDALISSGLATMGFALPAAVAAALVTAERRTLCLTGDGGLGMQLAELETLVRLRLPVTVVVFNDSTLSLIAIKQRAEGHGGSRAVAYHPTDYARIAEGFGMPAARVSTRVELGDALRRDTPADGPFLVDVGVDRSAYPHVLDVIRGAQ